MTNKTVLLSCIKAWALLSIVILVVFDIAAIAATTDVFRYTDTKGRAVFTDHALGSSQYRLIARTTFERIDVLFKRPPHLPIIISDNNYSSVSRSRIWRRKSKFSALIERIAQETKINANLIHAVVQAESAYNPKAHSPAGAIGLMQLMPATAKRYGVTDIWDPEQNLTGGAEYLRDLLDLFENNMRLAIAAYNAGEGAVLRNGNRIPPYPETREYVRRVIDNFRNQRG